MPSGTRPCNETTLHMCACVCRWGDALYSKGEYDAAMLQYSDTIGYLEPSYVIRYATVTRMPYDNQRDSRLQPKLVCQTHREHMQMYAPQCNVRQCTTNQLAEDVCPHTRCPPQPCSCPVCARVQAFP